MQSPLTTIIHSVLPSEDPFGPVMVKRPRLSPRLLELASLICEGHSNKECAYRMGLTTGSVKVYVGHLFERLHVGSRFEIIAAFYQHKLHQELVELRAQQAQQNLTQHFRESVSSTIFAPTDEDSQDAA